MACVYICLSIYRIHRSPTLKKIAYRPLRESPRITILISAIGGASFFLQNFGIVVFGGGRPKAFPVPNLFNKVIRLGGVSVSIVTFVIPAVTIILLLGLTYFITKTKTGMAMRLCLRIMKRLV